MFFMSSFDFDLRVIEIDYLPKLNMLAACFVSLLRLLGTWWNILCTNIFRNFFNTKRIASKLRSQSHHASCNGLLDL